MLTRTLLNVMQLLVMAENDFEFLRKKILKKFLNSRIMRNLKQPQKP